MLRAEFVLDKARPKDIDVLVLPELAFSGEFRLPNSDKEDSVVSNFVLKKHRM